MESVMAPVLYFVVGAVAGAIITYFVLRRHPSFLSWGTKA